MIELRGDAEETVESVARPPPPKSPPAPPATAPPPAAGTEAVFEAAGGGRGRAAAAAAAPPLPLPPPRRPSRSRHPLRFDQPLLQRCGKCRAAVSDAFRLDKPQPRSFVRLYGGRAVRWASSARARSPTRLPLDEVSRDVTDTGAARDPGRHAPPRAARRGGSGAHLLHLIHTATRCGKRTRLRRRSGGVVRGGE